MICQRLDQIRQQLNSFKKLILFGCIFGLIVHFFLRGYGIDAIDLDQDEVFTWLHSKFLHYAWLDTLLDVHPPTFTILMSVWQRIFGDSVASLRWLSLLFSAFTLITLIFFYRLLEPEHRTRYMFFVLMLFVFLPYEIHLARYARSYSMLVFTSAVFTYYFYRYTIDDRPRYLILSVISGSLSVYTHFQATFFIASLILAVLLCGLSRSVAFAVLKVVVGIGFVCLPLVPLIPFQIPVGMVINQMSSSQSHVSLSDLVSLFSPISHPQETTSDSYIYLTVARILILLPAASYVCLAAIKSGRFSLIRVLSAQLVILLLLLYLSPLKRIHDRSLCIFLTPVIILLSAAMAKLKEPILRKSAFAWTAVFVALSLASFPYIRSGGTNWRQAWTEVLELVSRSKNPVIVVSPSQQILPLLYLMNRQAILPTDCPIWIETPSVLFSPWDTKLDVHVNSDVQFGYWSTISKVLMTHNELTDIFLLRIGNVLTIRQDSQAAGPIKMLGRFGQLSLYHIKSCDRAWFTLFDANFYWENNPDIAKAGINPFFHFMNFGTYEGRNPNRMFDVNFYPDFDTFLELTRIR